MYYYICLKLKSINILKNLEKELLKAFINVILINNRLKVNVNTGSNSKQPNISYMHAPAYPNLMDIKSTIKGTIQDIFKNISNHQAEPTTVI